ncbi:ABC transporter [Nostocoides sp. F2B08]|uniref:GTPase n=1 Tax=Nostocoides sp. F2B08 TaxID=2653936 RepID=UPI001263195D|nr:GTPase [Tetrasphaera sp. F2B08]KAB7743262.1 ABC transporter [Tetrasphaera sp. F2B08]
MSPIRPGRAKVTAVTADDLSARSAALDEAIDAGGAQLDPDTVQDARAITTKVQERLGMTGGHTVVALAGATGSGKSSLFNALVGAEAATVGARRPTTSTPTAGIWGQEPVGRLLTWLGVGSRHFVSAHSPAAMTSAGGMDGLVLLDLPDFDSRETAHRAEAERVLALADVFVWVTDPQKYADARLHDDYVKVLKAHEAVMIVVLNHADRLGDEDRKSCLADLSRLLKADGVPNAQVLATSARTGLGVDELRQRLANVVAGAAAARTRLAGDVRTAAGAIRTGVADTEPDLGKRAAPGLVDALARAAGIPTVVSAVDREYRDQAVGATGWPFTRWMRSLRASPLRRLRLDPGSTDRSTVIDENDVRAVLGRSSLPPPTPAARAAVEMATRAVGDQAGSGLPVRWADAVSDAATPQGELMADRLDQAVVRTSLRARDPFWWTVLGLLQILLAITAVAGFVWLAVLFALGWLQMEALFETPTWGPVPIPALMFLGGLLAGMLLAVLARFLAAVGGRRRARTMDRRLRESIEAVATETVVDPVRAVLDRHRRTRELLDSAIR